MEITDSEMTVTKTCLFCDGEHNLDSCTKLKGKSHNEKIDFLKSKGCCFGCLKQGHMSKSCRAKVSCQVCSLMHPTLLHIKKKGIVAETKKETQSCETQTILSAFIAAESEGGGLIGAGEDDCTLAIVPVQNETTRFRTFVANRVSAILENSDVEQWRHVSTDVNPADCASRGQRVDQFLKNTTWVSGPEFLHGPEENWPNTPLNHTQLASDDPEIKKVTVNRVEVEENVTPFKRLINHFSSWIKLKRIMAWFLKLKAMLQTLCQKRKELRTVDTENSAVQSEQLIQSQIDRFKTGIRPTQLSAEDLEQAELDIIKFCQKEKYSEEIAALYKGQSVKRSSHLYKLNPVLQDDLLRVGGRLSRAAMPESSKQPVILSRDFHITDLLLQQIHLKTGHGGRSHMLSELWQRFWIPSANMAIGKVIGKCVTCRRLHGKVGNQLMADLPQERVIPDDPPFTRVGVDYFGPLEVKRGRTILKKYGVIFTCLAIRAVHIELASSLDTDSCINAIRCFIARRGQVKAIRSDNGTNFVAANHELKAAIADWNSSEFQHLFHQHGIKWSDYGLYIFESFDNRTMDI
ncbi:hypothetical protein MHYP_G00216170 [Metynnis hypsauchen]